MIPNAQAGPDRGLPRGRNIRRKSLLRTKGTRKISPSLRPRGPEAPCSASIPKVAGSNPGREAKGQEEKRKPKLAISLQPFDLETWG